MATCLISGFEILWPKLKRWRTKGCGFPVRAGLWESCESTERALRLTSYERLEQCEKPPVLMVHVIHNAIELHHDTTRYIDRTKRQALAVRSHGGFRLVPQFAAFSMRIPHGSLTTDSTWIIQVSISNPQTRLPAFRKLPSYGTLDQNFWRGLWLAIGVFANFEAQVWRVITY